MVNGQAWVARPLPPSSARQEEVRLKQCAEQASGSRVVSMGTEGMVWHRVGLLLRSGPIHGRGNGSWTIVSGWGGCWAG